VNDFKFYAMWFAILIWPFIGVLAVAALVWLAIDCVRNDGPHDPL
jgi:hypothetical protein